MSKRRSKKKKQFIEKDHYQKPRSIRFDKKKLDKARQMGVIKELSDKCREALDKLIGL
jgi:hypothetical protein